MLHPEGPPIAVEDLAVDALDAAEVLLGAILVGPEIAVRFTEVEAYRWPDDTACHCHRGRTERNAPLFGPAGHAYVYLCYGIHHLFNVVCGLEGQGCGVLIRSVEPLEGHDLIAQRRGGRRGPQSLSGPGKVGAALGVTTKDSGQPLLGAGSFRLFHGPEVKAVLVGPRVGIDYARPEDVRAPWRFADGDSRWVSQRKHLHLRTNDVGRSAQS